MYKFESLPVVGEAYIISESDSFDHQPPFCTHTLCSVNENKSILPNDQLLFGTTRES